MATYRITDADKFGKTVVDVDTSALTGSNYRGGHWYSTPWFLGTLTIEVAERTRNYEGEHDAHDYEDDYGFVLVLED